MTGIDALPRYTAVAQPGDLRDTNPGQPAELNDVVGCIRIFDGDGEEDDLVTYQPDEDESQATRNMLAALDAAGYRVVGQPDESGVRVTVVRDRP